MRRVIDKILSPQGASFISISAMRLGMLASKFLLAIFITRFIGLEAMGAYGLILGAAGGVQVFRHSGSGRPFVSGPNHTITAPTR